MALCRKPFNKEGLAFGCGQCLPCRINRRRIWTCRLMMESLIHPDNAFVTLTYDDDNLPSDGSLVPRHTKNWLKYLRAYLADHDPGRRIRYYLVGEYGENKGYRAVNPHYHLALFNYPSCVQGIPPRNGKQCLCQNCAPIAETWKKGLTFNARLEIDSAQYIAQYVTKGLSKMGASDLEGRHPEFSRMSNRPGIGADAIRSLSQAMLSPTGLHELETSGDVPAVLTINGKTFPMGRYLREQLRLSLGRSRETPEDVLLKLKLENQALRTRLVESGLDSNKLASIFSDKGRIDQIEAKHKLHKKVRIL